MATYQEIKNNDLDIYSGHNHGPMLAAVVVAKLREKGETWLFVAKDNRDDGRSPELKMQIRLSMPHRGVIRYSNGMESTIAGSIDTPEKPLTNEQMLCVVAYHIGRLGPWVFNLDGPLPVSTL